MINDITNSIIDPILALTTGIGNAIIELFQTIFLTVDVGGAVTGLSSFGVFLFAMIGISVAFGMISLVLGLVRR